MVGGEDCGVAVEGAELGEPVVAQLPGGLFGALAVAGGMGLGVELRHMDGDPIAIGKLADEGFVTVAIDRTEVEVAVGYGKGVAGGTHEVCQNHGVDPAANGQQHLLARGEEVLLGDVLYETVEHAT